MAQSTDQNYVKTETVLNSSGSTVKSVQYYNGLGYPTVSVSTTGDGGQTSYSAITYDALGREERKYAPVSIGSSIGYDTPTGISYGDNTPYGRTQYDALDRPVSVTTPGSAFASSPATIAYAANAANEVIRYGVSGNSLVQDGYYPATTLTKDTHTDADGKKVETFKNLFGNIVMQRVGGSLCTYYVYDNLDRLRFVLPPKYQSDKNLAATGYEYRYDDRGRITYKQLPGAGYTEYWYDAADRMICMRDAEMRSSSKYRFFIYDKFDRLVVQGLCTNCLNSSTVWNATFSSGSAGVLGTGYSNTPALTNAELEIANYYDGNQSANSRFSSLSLSSTSVSQKSQLTGIVTAATNGEVLAQAMLYDLKGNITSSKSKGIGGRIASNTNSYTYTNKLSQSTSTIGVGYGGNMTVSESFGYNGYNNQQSSHTLTVNHGTAANGSVSYAHNSLGRLSTVSRS
ncbi:DUF6443 domain-containing protein, partial [Xylanibacter ruminicola]|uniref:DUF6443 domain-containing protein n=1 Tax=Xylanibacter ruminicola TaxID=839 RepID=UPI001F4103AB